jgi:oligopeptide transport system permease protein
MPVTGYFEPGTYERLPEQARNIRLWKLGIYDIKGNPINPFVQLFNYYKNLFLNFDLGVSTNIAVDTPVVQVIADKAPYSIKLGIISTFFTLILGWTCGLFAAKYKDKPLDKVVIVYGALINALPYVIIILVLQLYITAWTGWPMIMKRDQITSWFTPIIIMVVTDFAAVALWLRRYTVDQMSSDYVKLAYAKGLPGNKVFFGHILRNAATPMAYGLPSSFIMAISGTLLIEQAFGIPGMGRFLMSAIYKRDNNVVQAIVFIYVALGVISVLLGDLLAAIVDPRIRLVTAKERFKKVEESEGGKTSVV